MVAAGYRHRTETFMMPTPDPISEKPGGHDARRRQALLQATYAAIARAGVCSLAVKVLHLFAE